MAVVIRLMRAGAKKRPFYRVVAADSRRQRDGRFLEIVGHYDPLRTPFTLVLEKEQVQKWLDHGAQPSTQVASLLRGAGMTWTRASKPQKAATNGAAKKKTARAKPRKVTERKTRAKASRAKRKVSGTTKPKAAAKA